MEAEDLSDVIDADALARLLATPAFDVDACRERIARYLREGDGDAGRGIEVITRAFKAHTGDRLIDHKPALIAQLAYTKRGAYAPEVCSRIFGSLGYPIWHHDESTRLLEASPFAISDLMSVLYVYAEGEIDRVARDLVSWVELADQAARDRLEPIVARAGSFDVPELGSTDVVGSRMLDVMTLAVPRFEDKLDRVLENATAQITPAIGSLAVYLETHDGPSGAPAYEVTHATSDPEEARARFEIFWRLARRYRALFDRHIALFVKTFNSDEGLQLLGILDEATELETAGARGERWRIMRAGPIVMTTTGKWLHYLPRLTADLCGSEAAARKTFATKLDKKRAAPPKQAKARRR